MMQAEEYLFKFIAQRPFMVRNAKRVLKSHIPAGSYVLDVGAGPGVLASMLEEITNNCVIYGIEINPSFHLYGADLAKRLKNNKYVPINEDIKKMYSPNPNRIEPVYIVCFMRSLH